MNPSQELDKTIKRLDNLLAEGRINAASVNILQKQKLVLKEENKRLYHRLDEAQTRINEQEIALKVAARHIATLVMELQEVKEGLSHGTIEFQVWTNSGDL